MRKGELFIKAYSPYTPHLPVDPSLGAPMVRGIVIEGPLWRERTGRTKGWIIKREEEQVLKVSGLRCTNCGYIELYSQP
ncbi:hypothetical protein J7L60_05060 [Candidatus Bathyarchaeota archaeon]|nr:hypothetical protein [Candidatus Bathyarchaeota archaeon]